MEVTVGRITESRELVVMTQECETGMLPCEALQAGILKIYRNQMSNRMKKLFGPLLLACTFIKQI